MNVRETCSCGASIELPDTSPSWATATLDQWRHSHIHERPKEPKAPPRDTQPPGYDPFNLRESKP